MPDLDSVPELQDKLHEVRDDLLDIAEQLKRTSELYYITCDLANCTVEDYGVPEGFAAALYAMVANGTIDIDRTLEVSSKEYVVLVRKLHELTGEAVAICDQLETIASDVNEQAIAKLLSDTELNPACEEGEAKAEPLTEQEKELRIMKIMGAPTRKT